MWHRFNPWKNQRADPFKTRTFWETPGLPACATFERHFFPGFFRFSTAAFGSNFITAMICLPISINRKQKENPYPTMDLTQVGDLLFHGTGMSPRLIG